MAFTITSSTLSHGTMRFLTSRVACTIHLRTYATGSVTADSKVAGDVRVEHLTQTFRASKRAGTIEDVFSSSLNDIPPLPPRFSELKKSLFKNSLVRSWNEVLKELQVVTEDVASRRQDVRSNSLVSIRCTLTLHATR